MPALYATASVALEQQPMRLHDAVDAFDVDCGIAFLAAAKWLSVSAPGKVAEIVGGRADASRARL
jgi:hypothetical protein